MTEDQRLRLNVARAFALAFITCPADAVEIAAMQLHAALQDLAHAYEGEMLKRINDVEMVPFWEDSDESLPL